MTDHQPLTPAQQRTAAELPWYRAWLLSTGRSQADLEPERMSGKEDGP